MDAVADTRMKPMWSRHGINGNNVTEHVRIVDGVRISVQFYTVGGVEHARAAYPHSGAGVRENSRTGGPASDVPLTSPDFDPVVSNFGPYTRHRGND